VQESGSSVLWNAHHQYWNKTTKPKWYMIINVDYSAESRSALKTIDEHQTVAVNPGFWFWS
jgi:hypothetical protein